MGNYLNSWLLGFGIVLLLPLSYPAFAETKLVSVSLKTEKNQNFNNLMQEAELTAINLIDREFNRSSNISEIRIIVSGERNGQEAPLLSAKVSRTDWQTQPKIQSWTKYYPKTGILLGFNLPPTTKPKVSKVSTSFNSIESDPGFRDD
ncbi:hypothetical protein [Synechocystis sp. PCC 7509]|uniref:hypothetical protein n=1 Tax=Synechocystis sp. PCC 7509 TaxID=927677 RepID=UPI0002AC317A|nr:hypothetical protein [Synechocystis sp. PCC 7509]